DLIAAARGPGSFTGIRIGIATAQGMAQVLGIPALGLCSLDIISWAGWGRPGDIVVVLDARKNEWYTARYRWLETGGGGAAAWRRETLEAPQAVAVGDLAARLAARPGPVLLAGEGAERAERELAAGPELAGVTVLTLPGAAGIARGDYAAREAALVWESAASGPRPEDSGGAAAWWRIEPYYIRLPEAEVRRRAAATGRT
ncbi:MAG: tRNA (adenosine(37)-N6)-threonylcarbamoyltransferase complex dimerization subunit type 1 TsaB, partial [Gracilibacteraceae bacterium]|nr:tRNA (adenosine(37)-N6)-threonylcarbamoyltransferase complex dimerization subunit type 1 TsaB [Gracilibacteraceae bacterium]